MSVLISWLLALLPNVSLLGADEWTDREAETKRCDHILAAAFLPARSENPEIDARLAYLRTRNLKHFNPRYIEAQVNRDDFSKWLDTYFLPGTSRLHPDDIFEDFRGDWSKAYELFRRWGYPSCDEWFLPWGWFDSVHDFGQWCDYHRCTAPKPRDVQTKP